MAQAVRLAITVGSIALAAWTWAALLPSWTAWLAALVVFLIGGAIAEATFRRLASRQVIRADLEDRVRNPPP